MPLNRPQNWYQRATATTSASISETGLADPDFIEKDPGSQHSDTTKLSEDKQIAVAGDSRIGRDRDRKRDNVVVVRVAASRADVRQTAGKHRPQAPK